MKKTLLILCALLLTSIGASAQEETESTAYTFKAKDWVSMDTGRTAADNVVSDEEANTITVTASEYYGSYANCIALGNSESQAWDGTITTASYTVSSDQHWFVVIGKDLSLADDASKLWWMNGSGGFNVDPSETATLTDGRIVLAWDLRINGLATPMTPEEGSDYITLSGWTGFGLTSSDEATHTSTISYIGFYTEEDLDKLITAQPYEFNATDWAATNDHATVTTVTANEDNTLTVTSPTTDLNVALSNSPSANTSDPTIGVTTGKYYITQEQTYFVVIGSSDLSTDTDKCKLWWMNGSNLFGAVPTVTTLGDDKIMFAWDLNGSLSLPDEKNHFDGWTCFALQSSTGESTIYDINFYTETEVYNMSHEDQLAHICTANRNVWTVYPSDYDTWVWLDNNDEKTDGSGMAPPCLSYYVWEGDESTGGILPNATITHETIEGLTPGVYEVSMLIRIIDYDKNDDGTYFTLGPGTTFNANGISQDIYLGVDAHDGTYNAGNGDTDHEDLYGTYTLYVEVGEEGTLSVSLDVTNATYNWISFKNLKVRLLDEDEMPTVSGSLSAAYGTLILPFDVEATDVPSGITAYTAGEVTTVDDESVLTLTAVEGELTAGTPYIIGGSANTQYSFSGVPTKYEVSYSDEAGLLTGTLVNMTQDDFTADAGQYVLQNHTEEEGYSEDSEAGYGLGFYPITTSSTGVTLSAYHCYLTLDSSGSGSGVRAFISLPGSDEATAIEAIEAVEGTEVADGAIYDLSGRKVSKAVKGVCIQNGKKVLVK